MVVYANNLSYKYEEWYSNLILKVILKNDLTSIGDHALSYCDIKYIHIPSNITVIGDYAFYYCSQLMYIDFDGEVSSFGNYAFQSCNQLYIITYLGLNEPSFGKKVFLNQHFILHVGKKLQK